MIHKMDGVKNFQRIQFNDFEVYIKTKYKFYGKESVRMKEA